MLRHVHFPEAPAMRTNSTLLLIAALAAATAATAAQSAGNNLGHVGRFPKWGRIEIALRGPDSQGRVTPNPISIEVDALLTSPSGKQGRVPGFYDGDGMGRLDGDVWKVRFSPDETGRWSFESTSPSRRLDGVTGSLLVTPAPPDAEGLWKWGRLESASTPENRIRYLKFRDGPHWLKAGCDDPENFLGRFRHYDTLAKRKAAIDYLAARGVNSMYMMTHNVGGDHRDVWPWLGETEAEAKANAGKDARFDVAKLEEWRQLFEHMHARGVVPYLVLRDDASWPRKNKPAERGSLGHARYYREMVARFGYLPALLFNISEEAEENYTLAEALACAKLLKNIDPYDHPVGIHDVNSPKGRFRPYIEAGQGSLAGHLGQQMGKAADAQASREHRALGPRKGPLGGADSRKRREPRGQGEDLAKESPLLRLQAEACFPHGRPRAGDAPASGKLPL